MLKKFCTLIAVVACVIGIASCAWGGVSLSAFPDPVFREYLKPYDTGWVEYDSNGNTIYDSYGYVIYFGKDDGILGDKEIERITGLAVSSRGIISLKGVEHFTALQTLHCGGNQLTTLDLSKNTALTHLDCDYNQLTVLNVSKNTALD